MGQAKLRGTKQQRVAEGITKREQQLIEKAKMHQFLQQRKPSPKHLRLMAIMSALGVNAQIIDR